MASEDGRLPSRSVVDARLGQIVAGTYRITRHIGSGGSGDVFAAEHVRLGKAFAIKLLRGEPDAERRATQRFRREAKAIARLSSEHIVSVMDCGELDDRTPYLVMELLEGEDLRSLLNREGALPARRALHLVLEACRGLQAVHQAGLVHRDLKPENLFITRRASGEDWCKVLDFGVAKMGASLSTAPGAILGTVRYMAPEQLADADAVGPATDVYALGAVLYECLAGAPLVDGNAVPEVMYRIMNVEPRPLSQVVPALPPNITAIVHACVEKSPEARPSDADQLARALSGAVVATRFTPPSNDTAEEDAPHPGTALPAGPARPVFWGIALVSMLGAALVGWGLRSTLGAPPIEPEAPPTAPVVAERVPLSGPSLPTAAPGAPPPPEAPAPSAKAASASPARLPSDPPAVTRPAVAPSRTPPKQAGRFDGTNPYGE